MPHSDFDFVLGRWLVHNRKLRDPLDLSGREWDEFTSTGTHTALPGGAGNIEAYETQDFPTVGTFHGLALRLYEPDTDLWRIWWSSSAAPGRLDPPLVGRFQDGEGVFAVQDLIGGTAVTVRFTWTNLGPETAMWQQAFSRDSGASWETNWVMSMTRDN